MKLFLVLLLFTFSASNLFAETYLREYTYKASEADSKISSRAIALDQVKILLLQEIGTHIRQAINITKDSSGNTYSTEDIDVVTAGLAKVEIVEEKWNGETFFLKAKIEANPDSVLNALEEYKKAGDTTNKKQVEMLKNNQRELIKTRRELERLKQRLKLVKNTTEESRVIKEYTTQVERIIASEMFTEGYRNYELGNYDEALRWFKKGAEKNLSDAQYGLASLYNSGRGVDKDYQQAFKWSLKAAEQGYPDAQFSLGVMYKNGDGVEQDMNKAMEWYRKAADQGLAKAQTNIGGLYNRGDGVRKNYEKAVEWYTKAADQGYALAQHNLGTMYLDGHGVEKDYFTALQLFHKAAEQDYAASQYNIAWMYSQGYGYEPNKDIENKWLNKACDNGLSQACSRLDR